MQTEAFNFYFILFHVRYADVDHRCAQYSTTDVAQNASRGSVYGSSC